MLPVPKQADELAQLKGTFLASLNHEIRTPLAGIMGMADLLLETTLDEDQLEYVNAARLCAESLFEILNATLEYSALEAGQFTLDESECSVREILDAALAQHHAKAEAKNLPLRTSVDPSLPETILGDGPRLRELLGHLIANAIKFTHAGSIDISLRRASPFPNSERPENWLALEVRDTGIGIPPEQLDTIFESFQQGERGLARTFPGLGLGLALARKLSHAMGGEIAVQSQLGIGSKFTVWIPIRHPAGDKTERVAAPVFEAGPVILAVDDNQVGLKVLRHTLQRGNLQVECVSSGRQALEAARRRRFDLVLMDLQMPEMDGLTATHELRKLPGYDKVPILALTANSSDEVREQCRIHGLQAFLSKPVEAGELLAAVSRYLEH